VSIQGLIVFVCVAALPVAAQGRGRGRDRPQPGSEFLLPFDTTRDGSISKAELAAALQHFDANGNGKVERSEVAGQATRDFGALDKNGDGALDREEMRRAAKLMRRLPQPKAKLPDPESALPALEAPRGNPVTPQKSVLGKLIFWEQQLASNGKVACGSCHSPAHGGADSRFGRHPGRDGVLNTSDDVFGSPGLGPQVTDRSAPAFYGTLHAPRLFWDGRAGSKLRDPVTGSLIIAHGAALETQSLIPILNRVEMSDPGRTWHNVTSDLAKAIPMARAQKLPPDMLAALATAPTYPKLFESAFGDPRITPTRIAFAIASYERTLLPDKTPFDAYLRGDKKAMTANQVRGWRAFRQSACAICHAPPFFSDHTFRNIGVRPVVEDRGRGGKTERKDDRGKFKVPSLRNVGLKLRFMHNGRMASLREVLDHYDGRGRRFPENLDPLLERRIALGGDRRAVIDFLSNALTDPRAAREQAPFDRPSFRDD